MYSEIAGRYTMYADVYDEKTNFGTDDYETVQDPDTGELVMVPVNNEVPEPVTIECQIRSIIDGGIRVAGTTETFGPMYTNTEYLRMIFPAKYRDVVTKRSKVTNIRHKRTGIIAWRNEESDNTPTQYEVKGPSPVLDPFGYHIETYTLLERLQTQVGNS